MRRDGDLAVLAAYLRCLHVHGARAGLPGGAADALAALLLQRPLTARALLGGGIPGALNVSCSRRRCSLCHAGWDAALGLPDDAPDVAAAGAHCTRAAGRRQSALWLTIRVCMSMVRRAARELYALSAEPQDSL